MAFHFETFSKSEILAINEAVVQANTKKPRTLACQCLMILMRNFRQKRTNALVNCKQSSC